MASMIDLKRPSWLPGMLACLALSACTPEQLYATGRNWQRQECAKLPDPQQRDRCYHEVDQPYETYKRESDAARGGQ